MGFVCGSIGAHTHFDPMLASLTGVLFSSVVMLVSWFFFRHCSVSTHGLPVFFLESAWTAEKADSPYSSRERFQVILRLLPQLAQNSFDAEFSAPHLPQNLREGACCWGAVCLPRPLIASTPNRTTKRTSAAIKIRLFCRSVSSNPPVETVPL